MSGRDDHQILAAIETTLAGQPLATAVAAVLDEIDRLRTSTGAVHRIEALRTRARTAEADADRLARILRDFTRTPGQIDNVLQLHLDSLAARVA